MEYLAKGGALASLPEVLAHFPPSLAPDERLWVSGPFSLREYRSLGNGSWSTPMIVAGGTGPVGTGLLVGSLIGNAAARSSARTEAARDAVPRWLLIDQGTLYLSNYGFYLATARKVSPWSWDGITSATMVGPGSLQATAETVKGSVSWLVESDWSELLFVLWAFARHPAHPQLQDGSWLPPGWAEWASAPDRVYPGGFPWLAPARPALDDASG